MICGECGKKYRSIERTRSEEDDNGTWEKIPVCRRCWDGVVLVDSDQRDDLVCEDCLEEDCPCTAAIRRDWQETIEDWISEKFPQAAIVWLPASEMGTYEAANWEAAGYERCPQEFYDKQWSCEVDTGECPNKEET